jgi:PAS domain S-box-containing protein
VTKVTESVLIIDDCLEDRETYRRYLLRDQQHTYRILEAVTGEQALQVCRQRFPDVIVMDYLLPDVDGLEFLTDLKTQFAQTNLPVIILTGRGNEQIAVQAMKSGAADYLVKKHTTPVSLRLAVENVLEKTRLSRQLLESEGRFQATFNQVAVGIAHVGLDGQWLLVNQKLCDIVAYTHEELNRLTLEDITHPDDRNLDLEYVVRMLTGEIETYSLEKRYIRQDNRQVWINLTVSLVHSSSGEPQYFICVVEDISDRLAAQREHQQALSALRESEARFQRLAMNIPGAIYQYVLHPDGSDEFTYISPGSRDIYELEPEELLRDFRTVWATIHPDDVEAVQRANARSMQTLEAFDIEFRLIPPSGCIKWVHAKSHPQRQENGDLVFDGLVMDISDRKQAQEKIHEQAALLDVTTDAIFVRDLECRVLYWNSGAERMYGWQAAEVLSKDCCEFLYKEISPSVEEALKTVVEQGEWQGELNKITKSGQEIIVSTRWTLMRDEGGQAKSILAVDTDITEKKQLEAQFYRAQRLESLGTLASGIAHDLNNILAPILTVAQLLPLKFPHLDEKNRQLLKILEDNSKRGAELVKQITAFARGAEGKHVPLQPRHLLKEIERIVKSTFPKSIEICINIATPNLWTVSADPTQIHQVLMNLCVNARDAMPDRGTLSISAENFHVDQNYARMNLEAKVGDYVVITVSDTGCGMPQEVLERIFEPFFTTKEPGKGTGLGLSTVIGIIKNHGGFVNVHSQVKGGSQFQVFLPAIEKQATQEAEDLQMARGNDELILVVDDEAFVRDIAKTSLEEFNYRVLVGSDGIDAFSLYVQHRNEISVVLMDIQMPSIDGLNAIRVLQNMNPSVKIIAISGLASNRKFLEASGIAVQAFLSKPYTIKELLDTIQDVLSEGVRG